jgi:hypothetical protein
MLHDILVKCLIVCMLALPLAFISARVPAAVSIGSSHYSAIASLGFHRVLTAQRF